MMKRIEMNVLTGEQTEIELTPKEVAAAEASTLAWLTRPPLPPSPTLVEQILASPADLAALKKALGI